MAIIPAPRWLPATIGVLAGLFAVKTVTLVRAVTTEGANADISMLSSVARAADAVAGKPPDAKQTDAKPSDNKPPDTKQADGKPIDAKPTDTKPADARPGAPAAAASAGSVPSSSEAQAVEPPVTASERAILLDLRQRRHELERREAALVERESVMTAAQEKLTARVGELRDLRQRLEALDADRRKQDDASWQGLVKLYETMKPRDAATIFNDLAMPVLVQVMDRMKDAKAAPILAAMDPDKARLVTQALAKLRSQADVETQPAAAPRPPQTPAQIPVQAPARPRQSNG